MQIVVLLHGLLRRLLLLVRLLRLLGRRRLLLLLLVLHLLRRLLLERLRLLVVLRPDGSLERVDILKSSGHKVLDDAAKRIVKMASPFNPFPSQLQQQADVLHITRSWEFLSSNQLRSY